MADETYTPDKLLAGIETAAIVKAGVLLSGENRVRDTVLGAILLALGAVVPGEENTGTGTVGGIALGAESQLGNYVLTCTAAAVAEPAAPAVFSVTAPDGTVLPDAKATVAYVNPQIGFTIAEGAGGGAVAFAAGDTLAIPVVAGSKKLKMLDKAAVDGSQHPALILAEAVDATGGDKPCVGYETGVFNPAALVVAEGTAVADIADALRARGIFLRDVRTL